MLCWWQEMLALWLTHVFQMPAWRGALNKLIWERLCCSAGKRGCGAARHGTATSSPEQCRQLDLWFPAGGWILWSFWPLLEDFLRMLKGKICWVTKDFLGQQLLHVSQKAALPCLLLLILLSRSVRSLMLCMSMVSFFFFFKATLQIHWNFSPSIKWRVKSRLIYLEL